MSEDLSDVFESYVSFEDVLLKLLLTPVPPVVLSAEDAKALQARLVALQAYVDAQVVV